MSQFDLSDNPQGTVVGSNPSGAGISGAELLLNLLLYRDAINSQHAGSSRPAYLPAPGIWVKNDTPPWKVYLYDGHTDVLLSTVSPGDGDTVIGASSVAIADKQIKHNMIDLSRAEDNLEEKNHLELIRGDGAGGSFLMSSIGDGDGGIDKLLFGPDSVDASKRFGIKSNGFFSGQILQQDSVSLSTSYNLGTNEGNASLSRSITKSSDTSKLIVWSTCSARMDWAGGSANGLVWLAHYDGSTYHQVSGRNQIYALQSTSASETLTRIQAPASNVGTLTQSELVSGTDYWTVRWRGYESNSGGSYVTSQYLTYMEVEN